MKEVISFDIFFLMFLMIGKIDAFYCSPSLIELDGPALRCLSLHELMKRGSHTQEGKGIEMNYPPKQRWEQ